MNEKREYPRIPEHIAVDVRLISLSDIPAEGLEFMSEAEMENISEGGVLFDTNHELPEGTFIELGFHFEEMKTPLFIKGKVVRSIRKESHFETGVKFLSYSIEDKELMMRHLAKAINKSNN